MARARLSLLDLPGPSSLPFTLAQLLCDAEPHADGLTSSILRAPLPAALPAAAAAGGLARWLALKRVAREDEAAPHDVVREAQLLEHSHGAANVVPLLGAFVDTSDPWCSWIYLVEPLYPLTLADALRIPPQGLPADWQGSMGRDFGPAALCADCHTARFRHGVAAGLLAGLAHLHALGIAHRDIKPSNILLSANGEPRLADLGTACRSSARSHTMDVGTRAYRAPELLFAPSSGYDGLAADVWSAGTVLAEFWTPMRQTTPRVQTAAAPPPWEQALASEEAWARLERQPQRQSESVDWQVDDDEDDDADDDEMVVSDTGYVRTTLFDERGDIALAGSIFELLGRPSDDSAWPEAVDFCPTLQRMPFPARPPAQGGLRARLGLDTSVDAFDERILAFCEAALALSASARPTSALARALLVDAEE